nr:hypothetical transcript [Hymenolepis microstoma]
MATSTDLKNSGSHEPHANLDFKAGETSFIINELILEYFKFNGLQFSESVFRNEMRHKHLPLSRLLLCQSLKVKPTVTAKVSSNESSSSSGALQFANKPVPLLYYFVEYFKSHNSLDI